MLHVMYITQFYHPIGPASITTHEIVTGLAERGHHIDILTPLPCFNECPRKCPLKCNNIEGIKVHRIPIPPFSTFQRHLSIKALTSTLAYLPLILYALLINRKRKFHLVIATYHAIHLAPFSAFVISRLMKAPLMIKCHDVVSSESKRRFWDKVFSCVLSHLNSIALRHAESILALSSELKFLIKQLYKIPDNRFVIIPNSVDTTMFTCSKDNFDIREKLEVQGKKVMLYIGSLTPPYRKKGVEFLIEAMPKVIAKEPDVILTVLGPVTKSVQLELENLASSLNIEKHVRFVESVPYEDMPRYISIADIGIGPLCPSLDTYGSTPRKVLEYMACAKPIIACHAGIARDLIIDGYNGCLVRYGNLKELASCILKLVRDQKSASRMGSNGRSHALTFYSQRVLADKLNDEILKMYLKDGLMLD